ncbi:uncharacterized protein EI97DRAFT_203879 [Westerdykella ornata]|uniref:Extracellular membrane protein CFEM domain-containing protein n=1 Tax=Westerdykella ornata TaxID=318751 RepID=A0A6A6J7N1_WESOR|nr:uncharacterized protein EI97DRAFT_203879 [Westerdykella ornata]KAF2272551.1 hypothetical protein EI97DRAFT_203879 [Westerdykella ornata]
MHSAVASSILFWLLAIGVSAHWDWVKDFPDCWRHCLKGNGGGCASSECICDASQIDDFLPPAVSCVATKCDANDFALRLSLLLPLEGYCHFVGNEIPDDIMSSAYAATTATVTSAPKASSTHKGDHDRPRTTKGRDYDLTATVTSTFTATTTNEEGQTLQIIVPVVIGRETISYGKTTTSTLEKKTTVESVASATARPTVRITSAGPTQTEAQATSTTLTSKAAQRTSNSNGSPFENMQAEAGRHEVPGIFTGLGAVIGMLFAL